MSFRRGYITRRIHFGLKIRNVVQFHSILSIILIWKNLKMKKCSWIRNDGRLGSRGGKDRFKPNKKAHISLLSGFKGLGGVFVPG